MFFTIYKKFVCCNVLQDFSAISSVHSFNLRRVLPHSLFIPFCRTSIRKKYFTFRLLPIWNILPSTVLNTNVTECFMHKIQNIDLSNFYKSP